MKPKVLSSAVSQEAENISKFSGKKLLDLTRKRVNASFPTPTLQDDDDDDEI